jgi:hypothetical protein
MRTFWLSFVAGVFCAFCVEIQAADLFNLNSDASTEETLPDPTPMPLHSPNSSSSASVNRVQHADILKASRVARAKQVAQHRLDMEMMARWHGINNGRPNVNAGFIFLTPQPTGYRWHGYSYNNYRLPYGYGYSIQ